MEMSRLKALDAYRWIIKSPASLVDKICLFGTESLLSTMDDKVLEQISNVAKLPGLVGQAMTMPDAHWGYGFPIGGVAAFDAEAGGIISAGGVGFDISCGIRCLRTNLTWQDILSDRARLADALFHTIPAGVGREGLLKLSTHELDQVLLNGAKWAIKHGFGENADLEYIEEKGCIDSAIPDNVSALAKKRQYGEMGTLGSGNHYLEVQVVEKVLAADAATAFGLYEGQIIISIHCGSRGLGHQIGTDYLVSLAKAASRLGIHLPDRELACAPILSAEGQQYIGAMHAGINCALANRQIITQLTRDCFQQVFPGSVIETLYDVSHNTCKQETHQVAGQKRHLFIHRKGATRAFGPGHQAIPETYRQVGQPVMIGGSMGTASYILAGNSPEQNTAFASASHGAGRAMSRHQALKLYRGRQLIDELDDQGIIIRTCTLRGVAEEAPNAYKDVDEVARATEQAGLARRVVLLRPKICVKG